LLRICSRRCGHQNNRYDNDQQTVSRHH